MNPRYAVLSALSALTGVCLSRKMPVAGFVLIAFLVIIISFQLKRKSFFILFFMPLFYFYSVLYEVRNVSIFSPESSAFQGVIDTIPDINGKVLSFQFRADGESMIVRYKMKSAIDKYSLKNLEINMNCKLTGSLKRPEPKNHFYGMDYNEYLHNKKIHWILEPSQIDANSCQVIKQNNWISKVKLWRSTSIKRLEHQFTENTAGLMNALLFGYRDGIQPEILDAYQRLGLTHLLAVSGFNVGIVSYFLYLCFVRIGIVKELAYVFIALFLPVYIVLTGGESSIIRAGIMGMLVLAFIAFGKKLNPAVLLSVVFIMMLFWSPSLVFDLGFQLSFLMTFVLISSVSLFHSKSFIQLLIITSCMCSLFSFPIILYHFYEFSLWSIPLNVLYIPFVSLVLFPVSFIVYMLTLIMPEVSVLLRFPLQILFEGSASFLEKAQDLNGTILLGRPSIWIIFLYFVSILFLFYRWEEQNGFHLNYCIPFVLIILLQAFIPYLNPKAAVSFINVGQGDSILIEMPYRKGVYLIDTGGSILFEREEWEQPDEEYDVTKKAVLPYLKGNGIRKIDGLFLSHGDMDHAGGAIYLLNNFSIGTVYIPKNEIDNELIARIEETGRNLRVNVQQLNKGMNWGNNESRFLVMHPDQKNMSSNNGSIVLWTQLYGTSFLFTGDIEREAEEELIKNYERLQADVLKVAHHGSRTSTTDSFLNQVSPKYAVLSLGKNNRYGHPGIEVISRLKQKKVKIYRTDQNGDVLFEVDKKGVSVITVH